MKPRVFVALSVVCFLAAFCVPGMNMLDNTSAHETVGGQVCPTGWLGPNPSYICSQVATCDTYNSVQQCPTQGMCSGCENGFVAVNNCVQGGINSRCCRVVEGTECGYYFAGGCQAGTCIESFPIGNCMDGPGCWED